MTELFTCPCAIIAETDAAILLDVGSDEVWVPLSQVEEIHRLKDGSAVIMMTAWIARKKGLI